MFKTASKHRPKPSNPRLQGLKTLLREADYVPFLPYVRHVDASVIALENNSYMVMYRLAGRSFETCDAEDLDQWHSKINLALRNLADDRLSIWTHLIRRETQVELHGTFYSDYARDLDQAYSAKLREQLMFHNEFYVTLIVKPLAVLGTGLDFLFKKSASAQEVDPKALAFLRDKASDFEKLFAMCDPQPLTHYEHDGNMFSAPMEVLHYVMTGDPLRIPLINGPLGQALYSSRIVFGPELIEIRLPHATRYGGMFGIREYSAHTHTGQFNALLKLKFPFIVTQSFSFIAKADASARFKRKRNQMQSSEDDAFSQSDALIHASDDLMSNRFVLGDHHFAMLLLSNTTKTLNDRLSIARAALADTGMVVARESVALEAAFWSQLPANYNMRTRPAAITSRNFAAFSPFYSYPNGKADHNHWGKAVALFNTTAGSPFWFNFHMGDLGHTLIIGPSGGGKTVLQNFLMAQLEKTGAQQIFIDKDRGAEIFVRAAGGSYLALKNGTPTGFAPLRGLADTPSDRAFLRSWLRALLQQTDKSFSAVDENLMGRGIAAVLRMDAEERSLGELRDLLGFSDPEGIGARLEKWCASGPLGWVFDNPKDEIALADRFIGFDMTDFLDNAPIRTPVMLYMFHRIEALLDGRRLVIDIDEFWKALGDDAFKAFAQDGLKTYRKRNACLVFGTQSPADALRSSISHSIIEQVATKILLPNPNGSEKDYCEGLGLTKAEFRLIREELTPESRCFLIKQGHNAVVATLDLNGMDDALSVLSGRAETLAVMESMIATHGEDPSAWLPAFYQNRHVS